GRHVPLSIEYRQLRQLDAPRMSPPWRFRMGGPAGGGLERALSWLARHAIRSQGPAGRASAGLSDVQEALEGQTAPVGTLLRLKCRRAAGKHWSVIVADLPEGLRIYAEIGKVARSRAPSGLNGTGRRDGAAKCGHEFTESCKCDALGHLNSSGPSL